MATECPEHWIKKHLYQSCNLAFKNIGDKEKITHVSAEWSRMGKTAPYRQCKESNDFGLDSP